jgi:hypothetical protein
MFAVEIYAAVRKFIFVEGNSRREAARTFGLSRDTIAKMCRYSAPPGYIRSKPPKLGPLVPVIEGILESDKTAPPKQRHTAKRIFERPAERAMRWRRQLSDNIGRTICPRVSTPFQDNSSGPPAVLSSVAAIAMSRTARRVAKRTRISRFDTGHRRRQSSATIRDATWVMPPSVVARTAALECYRRSHEIALAELDAAMAQDVVGGGCVKVEIRQAEI